MRIASARCNEEPLMARNDLVHVSNIVNFVREGLNIPDTPNKVAIADTGGSKEHALPSAQVCGISIGCLFNL